ncbi:MAG TPA: sortase, partial [Acidimicrobiales bacterium]
LVLGFVAYQLWGTNIQEARAQDSLEKDFAQQLEDAAVTPSTTTPTGSTIAPPPTTLPPETTVPSGPATTVGPTIDQYVLGEPVARIEIDRIGVDKIVVAGVRTSDLRKAPGHYPGTALPGEKGNAAIAGHRTTYGAPFSRIDELNPGDVIRATTVAGHFTYRVTERFIIEPEETWVLGDTPENILTLTSCHPRYSTRQRIVVRAVLDPTASDAVRPSSDTVLPGDGQVVVETIPGDTTTTVPGQTTVPPSTAPGETTPPTSLATASESSVDNYTAGWFDDSAAWPQVFLWAGALVAIGLLAGWLGRRTSRVLAFFLALVPFIVCLYFFYENVARLLPPNL